MVVLWKCTSAGFVVAWVCSLLCPAGDASAAEAIDPSQPPRIETLPSSVLLSGERLSLPNGEHVGMLGVGYVLELAPGWWAGPAFYGAASGERGGLFTWGAEGQRRWRMGESWGIVTGLYAGGGGGASAPVGGGLMLRPHADLMFNLGGAEAGINLSHVSFPSGGSISSTQLGFTLMFDDRFAFTSPGHGGEAIDFNGRGGIGADRMLVNVGHYGGNAGLGYVGLRLEQQATPVISGTLEAAGAASGGASGYMEALGGLSLQWPVFSPNVKLGVRGALGLAGGGAVDTGGGPIAKGAATARWQATPTYSANLEGGYAKAFNGTFSAKYLQVSLGLALDDRHAGGGSAAQQTVSDMEWSFGVLHYLHAARNDGTTRSMDLVGLGFDRAISQHFYLSGQAHSAIEGGAGAFSVGLVGLGARTRMGADSAWSAGAEALAGAAGGGGVASQGGLVAQPMAWVGHDLGTYSRLKLEAGYIKSRSGELSSPVAQLTWAFQFGVP